MPFLGSHPDLCELSGVSTELQHLLVETANVSLVPKEIRLCCSLSSLGAQGLLGLDKSSGMATHILGKQGCAAGAGTQPMNAVSHRR